MSGPDRLGAPMQAWIERIEHGVAGRPWAAVLLGVALGGAVVVGGLALFVLVWAVLVGLLR